MSSKADDGKRPGRNKKLLKELEAINRAFNGEKMVSRLASSTASSRSKAIEKSLLPRQRTLKQEDAKQDSRASAEKDKKSSIWSWRGLKALTHIRNLRFNCCFTLLVHSIEGLPAFFNDEVLSVHWKRRDGNRMTHSVRVSDGVANFEEELAFSCYVYGSRSGPHHSAKYEAKHFLLYASLDDAPELDLGKHRIDLTRLLPLTLEDLEEEKSSGNWTTSFKLSGKARGAILSVTFGYVVNDNGNSISSNEPEYSKNVSKILITHQNRASVVKYTGNVDQKTDQRYSQGASARPGLSVSGQSIENMNENDFFLKSRSEMLDSTDIFHRRLDEDTDISRIEKDVEVDYISSHMDLTKTILSEQQDMDEGCRVSASRNAEFSRVYEGGEGFKIELVKPEVKSSGITQVRESHETGPSCEVNIDDVESKSASFVQVAEKNSCEIANTYKKVEQGDTGSNEQIMEDLENALQFNLDLLKYGLDPYDETDLVYDDENHLEVEFDHEDFTKGKSPSLEDFSDSVANDFMEMLGFDHTPSGNSESEPESPRERLLREFEKDALASGGLFDFDVDDDPSGSYWGTMHEEFDHSSNFDTSTERPHLEANLYDTEITASDMEHLETESLMQQWGISDDAFQNSPSTSCSDFDKSNEKPFQDSLELPPLGDGLGSSVKTNNGGLLRSMSPALFKNSKIGGSLIMQASNPVVVPAEMGSNVSDILQGLSSVGIEKLSMQAKKLMPLEEITGKTVQQFAWEGAQNAEGCQGQASLPQQTKIGQNINRKKLKGKSSILSSKDPNHKKSMSLEDLAPQAMDEIEALSIEGLRMQCGMSDPDGPPNGEPLAFKAHNVDVFGSLGLHGTCGVQLMDVEDNGEQVDGLMGLSLTLDEWMRLDSGEINDEDLVNEQTSKILAAHHANSLDQFRGGSKGEKNSGRNRKRGLLGNNFTIALMVQLRDPLRDYEAVGSPMLALIQVERMFVPAKPRIYSTVSILPAETELQDDVKEKEVVKENEDDVKEQDGESQFKITEVHVAGLKVDDGKKLWGSNNQQSCSRWLLANGMGKKAKHPLMKSTAITASKQKDTLWSVSNHGRKTSKLDRKKW